MIVLHGGFEDDRLVLWGERPPEAVAPPTRRPGRRPRLPRPDPHPFGADARVLERALAETGLPEKRRAAEVRIAWLPSLDGAPVASSPLLAPRPDPAVRFDLRPWTVAALHLPLAETVDLLAAAAGREILAPGIVAGPGLSFAAGALGLAAALVARGRYLPGLIEHDGVFRAVWRPLVSGPDAARLTRLARAMPDACRALSRKADTPPATPALTLLTGFVEAAVDHLARASALEAVQPPKRKRNLETPHDEWLAALTLPDGTLSDRGGELERLAGQVREWRRAALIGDAAPFRLTFRLEEPPASPEDGDGPEAGGPWLVRYLLQASHDPSLLVPAEEAWKDGHGTTLGRAGLHPREHLLVSLGQAASLDPRIEESLRAPAPSGFELDAAGAFEFLTRTSMVLEQAGFGMLLPAWWTRRGARARLSVSAVVKSPKLKGGMGLGLDELMRFEWRIAVGGIPLTLEELRALARLKQPLVRLRGQWVQVSAEEIQAALEFWKRKGQDATSLRDLVRMSVGAAKAPGGLGFEGVTADGWVGDLLARLQGHAAFTELRPPGGFRGELRPYQLRGYSWLAFLKPKFPGGVRVSL